MSVRALWSPGNSWITHAILEKKAAPKMAGVTRICTDDLSNVMPNVDHAVVEYSSLVFKIFVVTSYGPGEVVHIMKI